jgi:gliding motility-associated-like protein
MQPIVYELCDDNMETDGDTSNDSVQFDLASQNAQVLDGQDPLNYTVSYYATALEADTGDNPLPVLYENTVNPQVIYVRVDNDTTPDSICYAVAELTLVVNPLPEFDLEDSYLLCLNTNGTEVVSPPVLDTALSDLDYTFEWTDASMALVGTGSSYTPTQGGTYTVVVTDILTGCINTDTTVVNESEPPTVSAEVTTLAFANQHDIQVTATGSGIAAFEYSVDNGPWQTESLLTDVTAGEHVVTVRDINGCGKNSVTVMVMDYPLYFTPNNDGYHDRWNIYGISSQPNAKIYIFDRYGKLLKQISPTGQGWDGMYNGAPLPSSDYWFMVEYEEPSDGSKKQFKAHFTLKR